MKYKKETSVKELKEISSEMVTTDYTSDEYQYHFCCAHKTSNCIVQTYSSTLHKYSTKIHVAEHNWNSET